MSLYNEQMIAELLGRVREGDPVVTEDGKQLGTVAGVDGQCIKVGAPLTRDYWLHGDSILDAGAGMVHVCFQRKDLNAYKLDKPAASEDPAVAQEDAVLPPGEQLEQRQRMERELEEQRRRRELGAA